MKAIPWYKSQVLIGAVTSILSQLALVTDFSDMTPETIKSGVDSFFGFVSFIGVAWAALARLRSTIEPLAATGAAAARKNGGFARTYLLSIIAAIGVLILLVGCPSNPVRTSVDLVTQACVQDDSYRVETCVGATLGVYEAWQRQGVAFVQSASTPAKVKAAIRAADAAATPAMLELREAERTYALIKAELAAGATSDEQLLIAVQNLERYVLLAQPRIQALITALGG